MGDMIAKIVVKMVANIKLVILKFKLVGSFRQQEFDYYYEKIQKLEEGLERLEAY